MPFYKDNANNRKLNRVGKEYVSGGAISKAYGNKGNTVSTSQTGKGGGAPIGNTNAKGGGAPIGNTNASKNTAPKPKEPKKKPGPKPKPKPDKPVSKKPGPKPKPPKPKMAWGEHKKTSAESKMETQINIVSKEWLKLIKTGVMQGISKKNLVPPVLKELLESGGKDINMPNKFISGEILEWLSLGVPKYIIFRQLMIKLRDGEKWDDIDLRFSKQGKNWVADD